MVQFLTKNLEGRVHKWNQFNNATVTEDEQVTPTIQELEDLNR